MRRSRKEHYITADFCIPESKWKGKPKEELQNLLLNGIRHTLEQQVAKLTKDKEVVSEDYLWEDVDNAFKCFRESV